MQEEVNIEQLSPTVHRVRHVYVWSTFRGIPFQHHGVSLSDGTIVHYCDATGEGAGPQGNSREFQIRRTTLAAFTRNSTRKLHEVFHDHPRNDSDIEKCALRFVGRTGMLSSNYELMTQNCEHFAQWCMDGNYQSLQVLTAAERATSLAAKASWIAATRCLTRTSAAIPARTAFSACRAATPWLFAADAARFATEVFGDKVGLQSHDQRQRAGLMISGGVAVAVGCFAGPAGVLGAVGAWAAGEACARGVSRQLFRRRRSLK